MQTSYESKRNGEIDMFQEMQVGVGGGGGLGELKTEVPTHSLVDGRHVFTTVGKPIGFVMLLYNSSRHLSYFGMRDWEKYFRCHDTQNNITIIDDDATGDEVVYTDNSVSVWGFSTSTYSYDIKIIVE